MKTGRKILISIAGIILVCIVLFTIFLLAAQALEYKPAPVTQLTDAGEVDTEPDEQPPAELHFISWNTGYSGLDKAADFVMEGGKQGIAGSRSVVQENLQAMISFCSQDQPDVLFLQEVDEHSHRSYNVNQLSGWLAAFPEYHGWFGINFQAFFVPYPLPDPIGEVKSGILTMSRFPAESANRYQLPGLYSWPVGLFNLKRCMVVTNLASPVPGRNWYLVNIHLDAYDATGILRREQLDFIKSFIMEIYKQNHYVVVGGDWNNLFPGIKKEQFAPYTTPEKHLFWVHAIPADWTPEGWQWAYDPTVGTSRSLEHPYRKGENFITVIDGFLLSPNIQLVDIQGEDLQFAHTDHNPVRMIVRIKE